MTNDLSRYYFDSHKYGIDTPNFNAGRCSEKPV